MAPEYRPLQHTRSWEASIRGVPGVRRSCGEVRRVLHGAPVSRQVVGLGYEVRCALFYPVKREHRSGFVVWLV